MLLLVDNHAQKHLSGVVGADQAKAKPQFLGSVPNVTVAVGRDAVLPCIVKNLQDYKVSCELFFK